MVPVRHRSSANPAHADCIGGMAAPSRRAFLLTSLVALAGCGLPQQGPRTPEIVSGAEDAKDYILIPVDRTVLAALGSPPRAGFGSLPSDPSATPTNAVGIGDTLSIRVLEAGSGGLFATGNGGAGSTDFPDVVVDREGRISLPYVGSIVVAGKTPGGIQTAIVEALSGKAIEPQALVTITRSENNRVTVTGDVANPGPVALALRGDRLSQIIAQAGGGRNAAHETTVTLIRSGRTGSARLSDVLLVPANDISLQRGDLIVLTHEPPRYTLNGAATRSGSFTLPTARYSVLDAVSAAGGLNDSRADPTGVFLFRLESEERLAKGGVQVPSSMAPMRGGYPAVYRFDMSDPESQFLAQAFLLADRDALYISNSASIQLTKIISLFDLGLTTTNRVDTLTE